MRVASPNSGLSAKVLEFRIEVSSVGLRYRHTEYVGNKGCEDEKGGLESHVVKVSGWEGRV